MSKRVDRQHAQKFLGARAEPEWSRLTDERLEPGVSFNGAPPLVAAGDVETRILAVSCWCGAVIGVVDHIDRGARGLPAIERVSAQVVSDAATRPVRTRVIERLLTDERGFEADCVVHGRLAEPGERLMARVRREAPKVLIGGRPTVGRYVLSRRVSSS